MVKFYVCKHCGNLIEKVNDSGVKIVCCGEEMELLTPNTVDASKEKHVPDVSYDENSKKLVVTVGSVTHPMEEKHYIQWIVFANENGVKRVNLKPGDEPKAYICKDFKGEIYEYCNLHGLWMTTVK